MTHLVDTAALVDTASSGRATEATAARVLDRDGFRRAMRRHAASVAVITAGAAQPVAFTATSLTSVSLEPPLVLFSLARRSSVHAPFWASERVAIHLLSSAQERVARTFATPGVDRFDRYRDWHRDPTGLPVLDDYVLRLVCRVDCRASAGDHSLFLVAPLAESRLGSDETTPLIYVNGRYASLT